MGIYMKFGNIEGDATQIVPGRDTGWIPLESFGWGLDSSITTKAGTGGSPNRAPKNPKLHDITVTKDVDLSSIALLSTLCTDEKGQDCTIVFVRTGDPGKVYLQYDLKKTLIKTLTVGGPGKHGDARPDETLILSFTEVTVHVWQLEEDNRNGKSDHITIQNGAAEGGSPPPSGGRGPGVHAHH
jgi:type VI protein secretion system component Hcp